MLFEGIRTFYLPAFLYKGGNIVRTKDRLPRYTKVKFRFIDDFTGKEIEATGFTRGEAADIRIRWPIEYAELRDDEHIYLVEISQPYDAKLFVVDEDDILEIL